MKSEPGTMLTHSLPLLGKVVWVNVRQGINCIAERARARNQFPSPFTLDDAFDQTFLARGGE